MNTNLEKGILTMIMHDQFAPPPPPTHTQTHMHTHICKHTNVRTHTHTRFVYRNNGNFYPMFFYTMIMSHFDL